MEVYTPNKPSPNVLVVMVSITATKKVKVTGISLLHMISSLQPAPIHSTQLLLRGPLLPTVKETSGIFQAKLTEGRTTSRSPIKLWALLPSLVHGQAPPRSTLGLLTILYSHKLLLPAVCWWSHIKGPRLRILSASVSLLALS